MKKDQAGLVMRLRLEGKGYGAIAAATGISINTIKSWCRRHPECAVNLGDSEHHCRTCGKAVEQNEGRKEKKFCSDKCRRTWWNNHMDVVKKKAYYTYTCPCCGKEFSVYANKFRKYCSRECYFKDRYGA